MALALALGLFAAEPGRADIAGDWNEMPGMHCQTVFGEDGTYDDSGRCRAGSADAGFLQVGGPPAPPHHAPEHVQVALPGWVYAALVVTFVGGVSAILLLARRRR